MEKQTSLTILGSGTSQGVPVIGCGCRVCSSKDPRDKRLRSSCLLRFGNNTIAIDAGPDFRQQMLREKVTKLDALLITHEHKDHIGGLDDIRAFNWIQQRPMDIFGRDRVLEAIKKEIPYAFEKEPYPGAPRVFLHPVDGQPFHIEDLEIIPIQAMHHEMPVYGYRSGNISYLVDANHIEQTELRKMKGSRIVVINGLREETHLSHFTLDEAIDILLYLNPEEGYITHISHQLGRHSEVKKKLPKQIHLAYDGLKLIV